MTADEDSTPAATPEAPGIVVGKEMVKEALSELLQEMPAFQLLQEMPAFQAFIAGKSTSSSTVGMADLTNPTAGNGSGRFSETQTTPPLATGKPGGRGSI